MADSFLTRQVGPWPLWAWMSVATGAGLLYYHFKGGSTSGSVSDTTVTPPSIWQIYPPNPISGSNPPASSQQPILVSEPVTASPPTTVGHPAPPTPVGSHPKPPASKGRKPTESLPHKKTTKQNVVTVAKYTTKNPPWNSTLWGIAQHEYGNGALWTRIASANHVHGTIIHPGQHLVIPKV